MFPTSGEYWTATRHPWSCVLFVVPLLLAYEIGLYLLGPVPSSELRNGADVWLRAGLAGAGIRAVYAAPVILVVILLAWTMLYRESRPKDPVGVWAGMTVESVIYAGAMCGVSRAIWPMMGALDVSASAHPALLHLIRYIGAGLYEEMLFRLLLFSGFLAAFNCAEIPRRLGVLLAAGISALLFAGAHNLSSPDQEFQGALFVFRLVAGLWFAWLYCVRGFGIVVGVHTAYDIMVGLVMHDSGR